MMKFSWKNILVRYALIFLLCNQVYSIIPESITSVRHLYKNLINYMPETNILFLATVVSLGFTALWTIHRIWLIFFILGQTFIIVGIYAPLPLSSIVLISFQVVGIILFLVSATRILFFLLSKKGYDFIESLVKRKRGQATFCKTDRTEKGTEKGGTERTEKGTGYFL
mgnify:FL=1